MRKQRESHLALLLQPEHAKIKQFFLGAWMHFTTIKREKRELLDLTRAELDKSRLRYVLHHWKSIREFLEIRNQRREHISHQARFRCLAKEFRRLILATKLSRRKRFLKDAAGILTNMRRMGTTFFAMRILTDYKKGMKRRVQQLMNKGEGSGKGAGVDQKGIEEKYKAMAQNVLRQTIEKDKARVNEIMGEVPRRLKKVPMPDKPPQLLAKSKEQIETMRPVAPTVRKLQIVPRTEYGTLKQQTLTSTSSGGGLKPPNQLYKRLEDRLYKERVPTTSFFAQQACPSAMGQIIPRLLQHAKQALNSVRLLSELPLKYHRSAAKRCGTKTSVNELIKASLDSKRASLYFTQWKIAFLTKWVVSDYKLLRCYSVAQNFFDNLRHNVEQTKSRESQTMHEFRMKLQCRVLRTWGEFATKKAGEDGEKVEKFWKRKWFGKWKRYIIRTAAKLVKIIKASEHFDQKVKSRFLHTLADATQSSSKAKRQYRSRTLRRYWDQWNTSYRKHKSLYLLKRISISEDQKRYSTQFAHLKASFDHWRTEGKKWTAKKAYRIKLLAAEHFRHTRLLSRYYFVWKSRTHIIKGMARLSRLVLSRCLHPRFSAWRNVSHKFRTTLAEYMESRDRILKYQCLAGWKQETMKNRLAKMFRARVALRGWWKFATVKRIAVPYDFADRCLQRKGFEALKRTAKNGWRKKRSKIIGGGIQERTKGKLGKMVLISLLENVMKQKRY